MRCIKWLRQLAENTTPRLKRVQLLQQAAKSACPTIGSTAENTCGITSFDQAEKSLGSQNVSVLYTLASGYTAPRMCRISTPDDPAAIMCG